MSPQFATVNPGDLMHATQVDQILNAWNGVNGQAVPMQLTALNDGNNWSLTVQNLDTVNQRSMNVMNAQGSSMIRVDSSGVTLGTPLNLPAGCISTAQLVNGAVTNAKIAPPLDLNGFVRVTGGGTIPAGTGLEMYYDGNESVIQSYNRTSSSYVPMYLNGSVIQMNPSTSFNCNGPVAFGSTLNVAGNLTTGVGGVLTGSLPSPGLANGVVGQANFAASGQVRVAAQYYQAITFSSTTPNTWINTPLQVAYQFTGVNALVLIQVYSVFNSNSGNLTQLGLGVDGAVNTALGYFQTPVSGASVGQPHLMLWPLPYGSGVSHTISLMMAANSGTFGINNGGYSIIQILQLTG